MLFYYYLERKVGCLKWNAVGCNVVILPQEGSARIEKAGTALGIRNGKFNSAVQPFHGIREWG